jgi:hypothetical protein
MPAITDAAAQLHAAGLPVLILDTCSIVDVIRAPIRPEGIQQSRHQQAALSEGRRDKGLHDHRGVLGGVSSAAWRRVWAEAGFLHVEHERLL